MERRLTLVLSVSLVIALIVIAYLLGLRSVEQAAVAPAKAPAPVVTLAPAVPAESAAPSAASSAPVEEAGSAASVATAAPPTGVPAVASSGRTAPPAGEDAMRAEVARYFAEADAIGAEAKSATGDPEALAGLILKHATDGDMSELDALLRTQRGLLDRLRAVAAPAPCVEHQRKSVAAVEDGITILERTRDAIVSRDVAGINVLTAQGQDLERRAREVDALGAALKKRYGL
jgi:hypothetical protein